MRLAVMPGSVTSPHCRHCQAEKLSVELPASINTVVTIRPRQREQFTRPPFGAIEVGVPRPCLLCCGATLASEAAETGESVALGRNQEARRDKTVSGALYVMGQHTTSLGACIQLLFRRALMRTCGRPHRETGPARGLGRLHGVLRRSGWFLMGSGLKSALSPCPVLLGSHPFSAVRNSRNCAL